MATLSCSSLVSATLRSFTFSPVCELWASSTMMALTDYSR
jgi:hypothetical protein